MRAVFVKRDCLVGSGSGAATAGQVQLRPDAVHSLELLSASKLFTIVLEPKPVGPEAEAVAGKDGEVTQRVLDLIRAGGGKVDALLQCPHRPGEGCGCWDTHAGFLYAAAARLDLRLNECYLVCDTSDDVLLAYRAGCRPVLVLGGRSVTDLYDGYQPEPSDFPIARDLSTAVQYVLCEEEAQQKVGHARRAATQQLEAASAEEMPEFEPSMRLFSPVPGLRGMLLGGVPLSSERVRQLVILFVVGGVSLSLGIAYLLTQLYRQQPFPEFVWYLTLQFIPRPIRGLLFVVAGLAVVAVSLRSFMRLVPSNHKRK